MDAAAFLRYLASSRDYRRQLVHVEHIAMRGAVFGKLDKALHPVLEARLKSLGISGLYRHQVEALNAILTGDNVIVATASASGKSLCYHLPTLEATLNDRDSRALYIFPTKALAHDQRRSLREIACPGLLAEGEITTFDGDTPRAERANIKKRSRVLLTNPDMLHLGILPNHQSWSRLFRHLKYVVIDEAHVYRGIFGSHMANVVRRLRRTCALYGSNPQYICCSATIGNPREHAENLIGLRAKVIAEDGSPHGEKYFAFWNPPAVDEARSSRRSANSEAAFLLIQLIQDGLRSLVFARSRKLAELICLYAQEQLAPELRSRVSPYRAGYLPEERRRIEQQFSDGELLGLVATTALELGIDIGDLGATVLTGYPGSIASAWQQ
ncbi:MAG: DEAD/DEAH box helicase, partial [Dehalococcoidia bacterium]|nr:DEAD/DEAH box helicase [Dehalococcoidia bacterium]